MGRRRVWWSLFLALAGLGWAGAHALAHRVVMPAAPQGRPFGLQEYLAYLPTSLALCVALALALAAGVAVGRRWKGLSGRSLWLFGVVPVLGFFGHAVVEPLVAGHGAQALTKNFVHLTPVVLVGLFVQVPFALAAVALARRFFAVAASLAAALVGPRTLSRRRVRASLRPPRGELGLAAAVVRSSRPRAPPLSLAALV